MLNHSTCSGSARRIFSERRRHGWSVENQLRSTAKQASLCQNHLNLCVGCLVMTRHSHKISLHTLGAIQVSAKHVHSFSGTPERQTAATGSLCTTRWLKVAVEPLQDVVLHWNSMSPCHSCCSHLITETADPFTARVLSKHSVFTDTLAAVSFTPGSHKVRGCGFLPPGRSHLAPGRERPVTFSNSATQRVALSPASCRLADAARLRNI